MAPKIILFLGRPGSGKGTQTKLLQEKFKFEYIGSGDLLRAAEKNKNFSGKKISSVIDKGGLVPTPVIFKLWLDKFEELKSKKNLRGIIIDGSPRKILEAYLIDEALEWYEWHKDVKIFLIDISSKESIKRLTKRKICEKCGKIIPYLGEYKNIKVCPDCGGKLIQRKDDNIEAIKKRLKWFNSEVRKVINYYKKTKRLIRINGAQSIEDVFKEILKYLK
ncbi:MAG: adenylate kinase family protein [Minisyncoccia bacterium]